MRRKVAQNGLDFLFKENVSVVWLVAIKDIFVLVVLKMSTKESHHRVKAIDAQTTEDELIEIYKTWSETYDKVFNTNIT